MDFAQIDQEVINSLTEIADGDPAFLRELQSIYLKQFQEKAPEIDRLARSGQWKELAAAVHMIKSSSAILGAMNFHGFCASFEQSARNEDSAAVAAQLTAFQEAFTLANAAIQKIAGAKKAA